MTFNEKFNAFKTILVKEYLRFIRIWIQTVLPPAITTALYFVIFGNLIGSQISDIDGYSYMDYIVPGLILMAVITNSYANVVSSFYSAKFQKSIEELLVSPTPNYLILAGFVSGGVARGVIVGIVVTLVAMYFSDIQIHSLTLSFTVFLLTAILFSIAGFINAIFARSFDDITIIPTFVLTPLTYLGGIFYSINMLPEFWQKLSLINPILYMINSFRYGLLGVSDTDISSALFIIIIFIISLFSYALYLLNKGTGIKS
ncbi:MAG: ABC transporter permease [Gammaproteobacteria bacterium]|nr:ABC transporter permease [Gammaproteobacteria bacterium]MCW8910093.1 ABC transporter permease [Gammaproteobacteria bacterium]MCW9005453.1 ABC transporter permease [Gammaproteobacteria bacterium]MCW9057102.1 ABC transporter permease [Gammaproteobacteria bacterium]